MCNKLFQNWTFWYDKTDSKNFGENWDQFLIKIYTFNTTENFFRFYNGILPVSHLSCGSNYHLFRTGIEPKWEDPANLNGGRWVFSSSRNHALKVDKIWEKTIYELLNEKFSYFGSECVKGLVGSARKNEIRIAIWTADAFDQTKQFTIGKYWKTIIEEFFAQTNFSLNFFPNKEIQKKSRKKKA